MKNIMSVLYVLVILVKHQEQSIEFTIVIPIFRNQIDLSESYLLPSHLLNSGYMMLLKVHWFGISLPLFRTLPTKYEKCIP